MPPLKSGKIKAIAVAGAARATQLPDVPTWAESGFTADSWLAVVAPRGLPADAQARLQKALADTLADADIRSRLVASGLEPAYEPAPAVTARMEEELPRMRTIAQRANIRAE